MKYLIDTNVLSEAVKTVPDTSALKVFEKFQHEIVTTAPVWHELQFVCQRLISIPTEHDFEQLPHAEFIVHNKNMGFFFVIFYLFVP
ncbi:MAG: PIN domain-containing protein [Desulfobacterales bacterium]|nr:PIN domain-containing protein [Desulfobacterales bacterium]MDP6683750.1 PIN domain-containing protein [Desulfobacterales bacterium]MDP6806139.1 PIN domain-containing protein [Desulfobacterales bacterium]|tara:strand:- start:30116 stop:30376 length:261 start_codon:yes stop_codon:yes gene_type:complete